MTECKWCQTFGSTMPAPLQDMKPIDTVMAGGYIFEFGSDVRRREGTGPL